MFGKKDGIKEFEQMRQALKPAERFATRPEDENPSLGRDGAGDASPFSQPSGNNTSTLDSTGANGNMNTTDTCSTVLSNGTAWQGNLKTQGSVRVEGQFSGEIDATDTVYVAEGAQVDAKIRATFVVLAGQFKGEVNCGDRLEITPTGQVRAELTTKSLVVHEGAFMEGQIHMTEEKAKVAQAPGAVPSSRPAQPAPKLPETNGKPTPVHTASV